VNLILKLLSFRCHGHKLQEHTYHHSRHLTVKRYDIYPVIDKITSCGFLFPLVFRVLEESRLDSLKSRAYLSPIARTGAICTLSLKKGGTSSGRLLYSLEKNFALPFGFLLAAGRVISMRYLYSEMRASKSKNMQCVNVRHPGT
jgi:hypothetical protein